MPQAIDLRKPIPQQPDRSQPPKTVDEFRKQLPVGSGSAIVLSPNGEIVPVSMSDEMAKQAAAIRQQDRDELIRRLQQASPSQAEFKVVDVTSLPPEQQARALDYIKQVQAAADPDQPNVPSPIGSVQDIISGSSQTSQVSPVAPQVSPVAPQVSPVAPQVSPVAPQVSPVASQVSPVAATTESATLSTMSPMTECPHCGWDLNVPDIAEPDQHTKHSFIQALLGLKCFSKNYEVLGGHLVMRFRTLTTREIDTIYHQAMLQNNAAPMSRLDYWELVNRYRLYLQLQRVESSDGTMLFDLPDGFTPATNNLAEAHWQIDQNVPGDTGLLQIADYIVTNVLKTEQLLTIVTTECAKFNRLVAKLEAMADQENFWRATSGGI